MVKLLPTTLVFREQFGNSANQAQFTPCLAPRADSAQTLAQGGAVSQQMTTDAKQHQHRYRHQGKHSRPRFDASNLRFNKSQQPFGIAKPFLAAKASSILLRHLLSAQVAIANQMPDTPFALAVALTALRDVEPLRVALAVAQASQTAPPLVSRQGQLFEFAPLALVVDFDIVFGANDKGNPQIIEQSEQFAVGKASVCRQQEALSGNRRQDFGDQDADDLAFIATALVLEVGFLVGSPVERDGATANTQRGDQEVTRRLNRPVQTETKRPHKRQLRDHGASALGRQFLDLQRRIVQQAGEATRSRFKVVEIASQLCLTATPDRKQRQDRSHNRFALMTVCVIKDRVDILNKASWGRVLYSPL